MLNRFKKWLQSISTNGASEMKDRNEGLIIEILLAETEENIEELKGKFPSKELLLEQVQAILSKDEINLLMNLRGTPNLSRIEVRNVMDVIETHICYQVEVHLFNEGEEADYIHIIPVFEYHDFFFVSNKACSRRANHFELLKAISQMYAFQIQNDFSLDGSKVELLVVDCPIKDLITYNKEKFESVAI